MGRHQGYKKKKAKGERESSSCATTAIRIPQTQTETMWAYGLMNPLDSFGWPLVAFSFSVFARALGSFGLFSPEGSKPKDLNASSIG